MKIDKYFILEKSPIHENRWLLKPDIEKLQCSIGEKGGSFSLLAARLLNMSYAKYCRMCRDMFDAEIIGKNTMYPVILFMDYAKALQLSNILNKQTNTILFEKENNFLEKSIHENLKKNENFDILNE